MLSTVSASTATSSWPRCWQTLYKARTAPASFATITLSSPTVAVISCPGAATCDRCPTRCQERAKTLCNSRSKISGSV